MYELRRRLSLSVLARSQRKGARGRLFFFPPLQILLFPRIFLKPRSSKCALKGSLEIQQTQRRERVETLSTGDGPNFSESISHLYGNKSAFFPPSGASAATRPRGSLITTLCGKKQMNSETNVSMIAATSRDGGADNKTSLLHFRIDPSLRQTDVKHFKSSLLRCSLPRWGLPLARLSHAEPEPRSEAIKEFCLVFWNG